MAYGTRRLSATQGLTNKQALPFIRINPIPRNDTKFFKIINNLREKFSPGPEFVPGPPALHAGALTN